MPKISKVLKSKKIFLDTNPRAITHKLIIAENGKVKEIKPEKKFPQLVSKISKVLPAKKEENPLLALQSKAKQKNILLIPKVLLAVKKVLDVPEEYKEPFSGRPFPSRFACVNYKLQSIGSKYTSFFVRLAELCLLEKKKEFTITANELGETYFADSLHPSIRSNYFAPILPLRIIAEETKPLPKDTISGNGEVKNRVTAIKFIVQ